MRQLTLLLLILTFFAWISRSSSQPQLEYDADSIAISYRATGGDRIHLLSPTNTDLFNMIPLSDTLDRLPYWSPDGGRLAFMRELRLHVMDANGEVQRWDDVAFVQSNIAWSGDNTRLAVSSGLVDIQAGIFIAWNDLGLFSRGSPLGFNLDWSPTDARILYSPPWSSLDDERSRILDLTTFETRPLLPVEDDVYTCCAVWSPDGTQIAFFRYTYDERTSVQLYVVDKNGRQARIWVDDVSGVQPGAAFPIRWSPDGTQLAYLEIVADGTALYTVNLFGVPQPNMIVQDVYWTSYGQQSFDWSPDGQQITYLTSDRDVAVVNIEDRSSRQLTEYRAVQHLDWRPAQLQVGNRAKVVVIDPGGLKVRTGPGIDYDEISTLQNDEIVTVVNGPRTSTDGLIWWHVEAEDGLRGWSVQSADGIVTLLAIPEPFVLDHPEATLTPTIEPTFLTPTAAAPTGTPTEILP